MAKALRKVASTPIPQTKSARGDQAENNAGGFVFQVSDVSRLERILILGVDGGSYYVNEDELAESTVDFLRDMIHKDEDLVLRTTVEISEAGRAYKNDVAIFVMALLLAEGKNKSATVSMIPSVVRTGTHVYTLASSISSISGWGPAKRRAVAKWFKSKTPDQLAYQAVKYRQRNGWTMRDLMRKARPAGVNYDVGNFILGKAFSDPTDSKILHAYSMLQAANSTNEVLKILSSYKNVPWEAIPTRFHKEPKVWKKLLENGQLRGQALIRNITRLARMGMFDDLGFASKYAHLMTDEDMIRQTRLHPMQYLLATVVHSEGQIDRRHRYGIVRKKDWPTSSIIMDALDNGFGLSFGNIEPSNKRTMISIDISSSMAWNQAGTSDLTAAQAAGAMALITARTEPLYVVNGFSTDLVDLGIDASTSISGAMRKVQMHNFGSTDCAKPVTYAESRKMEIDTFIIITDNETWAGRVHPFKALQNYRRKTGIPARMAVMGMTATEFSIADPSDPGMLDVVGFDTNTPSVVADFSAGRI